MSMEVIGVDIGDTKISAGIVKNKKLIKLITRKTDSKSSKNKIINQLIEIIEYLFNPSISKIGIDVPAIVDKAGTIYEAVNIYSWNKVPLRKMLEKKFKVPVFINNDANCFALGEKYFGNGKKYDNLVGLIFGTGVGAGIIINRRLYHGKNGAAGEFGQITYLGHDVEHFCSGKFFRRNCKTKGEILFKKALKGDKNAKKIFEDYGKHLGKALSIVVNSVDPPIIIMGALS